MKWKRLLITGIALVLFAGSALSVSAAGLKDIFDAKYYTEQYPDLKAVYGDDAKALYRHFVTSGIKEGRNMSPVLDVVAYRSAYPDLDAAFGDNWDAYVNHYFTCGIAEHRTAGALFNPLEYSDTYEDIKLTYGSDVQAIVKHYIEHGRSENRTAGTCGVYKSLSERDIMEKPEHHNPDLPRCVVTSFGYILYDYNEFGQIIKEQTYYTGKCYYVKEWDRYGKLLRDAVMNADAVVVEETLYTYNPVGKVAKTIYHNYDNKTHCEKTYDHDGHVISEKRG